MYVSDLYFLYGGCIINKIETLRAHVDERLEKLDSKTLKLASAHLLGVAALAHLLAARRQLDKDILIAAGLLHDLWSYEMNIEQGHAAPGAQLAQQILDKMGLFSKKERKIVVEAIAVHSDKKSQHGPYAEALKDADTLQHYLAEPAKKYPKERAQRIRLTGVELGIIKLKIYEKI